MPSGPGIAACQTATSHDVIGTPSDSLGTVFAFGAITPLTPFLTLVWQYQNHQPVVTVTAGIRIQDFFGNNLITQDDTLLSAGGSTQQIAVPWPATGTRVISHVSNTASGDGINAVDGFFQIYCNPTNPTVTQPCCPPDPQLQNTLNYILGVEQNIYNLVQQLQTGGLPRLPLYQDSTVHAGLSGAGTITLQTKAVAFRVDVTSNITNWPHNIQVPTYYFSMGFVTSYALTSPIKGWRLVYQSQDFPLAAECDQIGYTLPAGITVNITELLEVPGQ